MGNKNLNNKFNIKIPDYILKIINRLEEKGYEAYVVGGCVRDTIRGINPHDWDICTSAMPDEIISAMGDEDRVIPTGIKHGTVTIEPNRCGNSAEVTTYRTDGEYKDNRRPDKVEFVKSLAEDLKRRDFTVNAMAYNPKVGLVDLFGGQKDLKDKIIRCVGDSDKRFNEDALRIIRGLRFAAVCGFDIEEETGTAMLKNRGLLKNISVERIYEELKKLLAGCKAKYIILNYRDVFKEVMPECFSEENFDSTNIDILNYLKINGQSIYLGFGAILLNAADKSAAEQVMRRLKSDNDTRIKACTLAEYFIDNNYIVPKSATEVKHFMKSKGRKVAKDIAIFGCAYNKAYHKKYKNHKDEKEWQYVLETADKIIQKNECFELSALSIKGNDLSEFNFGRHTGEVLNTLLDMVIDKKAENSKDVLLKLANEFKFED